MLRADHLCITYLAFLQLCSAQDVTCTVTRYGELTLYSVPEFAATDCHYRWTNSTNHVLANQGEKIEGLVVMKSNRSLHTNQCSEIVHYMRDCISEGTPREANCTTDCSENECQNGGGVSRSHWIIIAVGIMLLVVVVVLFMRYKCRNRRYKPDIA